MCSASLISPFFCITISDPLLSAKHPVVTRYTSLLEVHLLGIPKELLTDNMKTDMDQPRTEILHELVARINNRVNSKVNKGTV